MFLQKLAKNEKFSICREAIRYNYPESVISKFPWRKIAKKSGEDKNWKTQNSGMLSVVSGENQEW